MSEKSSIREWVIRELGADGPEQAIRIINGTALAEADSRRHQMMVALLEGEALQTLSAEQEISYQMGRNLIRTGLRMVQREIEKRFRLDQDRDLRDCPQPDLTAEQVDALLRLNGALEAIAWRDPSFDVRDLQIVLRAARSGTPLTGAQINPTGSDAEVAQRLDELSDESVTKRNWPPKGRLIALRKTQSAPEEDGLTRYELTGDGRWVMGLLDRLTPDPVDRSADRALDALTGTGLSIVEMSVFLRISLAPLTRKMPTCLGPGYGIMMKENDATSRLKEKWLITPLKEGRYAHWLTDHRASIGGAELIEQMAEVISPDPSLRIGEDPETGPEV